jgi:hypothetical protein
LVAPPGRVVSGAALPTPQRHADPGLAVEYQELIADGPAQPPAGTYTSPYDRPNVLRNIDIYLFETSQARFTVGDISTLW